MAIKLQQNRIVTKLPRYANQSVFATDTLTLNLDGLTNVTAYNHRIVGGATQGTEATLDTTGLQGQWIECVVTCDQGVLTTPAVMVYMSMAAMHSPQHDIDDEAIVALCPHAKATSIAVQDGLWSSGSTWQDGRVPGFADRVLVPFGRTVTYDNNTADIRLDKVRVDGTLQWPTDASTQMLVETLVGTRGSTITIGTNGANRVQDGVEHEIIISGRATSRFENTDTDILLTEDPELWGRGFISQGTVRIWGKKVAHGGLAAAQVMSGAESLTLEFDPVGWEVGKQIAISGMILEEGAEEGDQWIHQDEEVTITGISGRVISWSGGLTYDHGDYHGERTDIRPVIQYLEGRNVTLKSEITNRSRRGHFSMVHPMSTSDVWGLQCLDMGRTDQSLPVGQKNGSGEFEFMAIGGATSPTTKETFTETSNIRGRYGIHAHHLGQDHGEGPRPIFAECFLTRGIGWQVVHHACDADFIQVSVRDTFSGCMVSEQGNERGAWVDCILSKATAPWTTTSPKGTNGGHGRHGDAFKRGALAAFKSRAIQMTGNKMFNGYTGGEFFHRSILGAIQPFLAHDREHIELKDIALGRNNSSIGNFYDASRFPITHFIDNLMISVAYGFFVTKDTPNQDTDLNVRLRRNTVWAANTRAADNEYVVTYVFDNWDASMAAVTLGGRGTFESNTNSFQIVMRNNYSRPNGTATDWSITGGTAPPTNGLDDVWEADNKRYYSVGNDFASGPNYSTAGTQVLADVTYQSDDMDNTEIDFDLVPSETYPLVVGVWNGTGTGPSLTSSVDNTDGAKATNYTSAGKIANKLFNDGIFVETSTQAHNLCELRGYFEDGDGWVLRQLDIISDEISGRPQMIAKLITCTAEPSAIGANNGPITKVETAISATDIKTTCVAGGSVVIDVPTASSASGGNGTVTLHTRNYIQPDFGRISLDGDTGEVTYTPYFTVDEGQDEFYISLQSGDTMFEMVRVNVLIGAGGAVETPVEVTHFDVAAGGAGEIDITLTTKPDTKGRHIRLSQYSTDSGSTWRRISNRWISKAHTITTESDGTTLSAGTYGVLVRYYYEHDYEYSPASSSVSVVVS